MGWERSSARHMLGTIVMLQYIENIDISLRIVSYWQPQCRIFRCIVMPIFFLGVGFIFLDSNAGKQ